MLQNLRRRRAIGSPQGVGNFLEQHRPQVGDELGGRIVREGVANHRQLQPEEACVQRLLHAVKQPVQAIHQQIDVVEHPDDGNILGNDPAVHAQVGRGDGDIGKGVCQPGGNGPKIDVQNTLEVALLFRGVVKGKLQGSRARDRGLRAADDVIAEIVIGVGRVRLMAVCQPENGLHTAAAAVA